MDDYLPLVYVLLFTIFWSLQIFISKLGFLAGAQLIPFSLQSSIVTLLLLGAYVFFTKRKELQKVSKKTSVKLYFASALHAGIGGFLSNAAVLYTSAINVAFLFQFTTVATSLLAWVFLKEKMTVSKAITITLVMIGIFLFVTNGRLITPHFGDILALAVCAAWSTGNVWIRGILKTHPVDADVSTFFRPVGGLSLLLIFIILSPIYPATLRTIFQTNIFDFHLLSYVLLNALFIVLLWIFLNRTLKVASVSYMTILSSLSPIIVAILGFVFLHETLTLIQLIGAFLIVFGGIVTQYLKIDKH